MLIIFKNLFIEYMNKNSIIFVAGHKGLVGSAILRKLINEGYTNIITKTSKELDLTIQADVEHFFLKSNIEYVFLAAAKVGGILSNSNYKADFIYINLMIQTNIIHLCYKYNIKKLLFLGSNCVYPKINEIPIKEEALLSGYLEPTNQPYAIAKISGLEMCKSYHEQYNCNFISLMPVNLYGPNDNYDIENSHVLAGLLRRFIEATKLNKPTIAIWGTGNPKREFLHVDDLAEACLYFMNNYNNSDIVNIGYGEDISIKELAIILKEITGFKGEILFDSTKPDGTIRKLLDINKAKLLGWSPKINLKDGIIQTYEEVLDKF
jgi:GDP-L-fucose synthase